MSQDSRPGWTRREALGMLGMGTVAAALPEFAHAADLTFPKGAVIRAVLKDYAPEELAGAASLFHEHMSFADDFMTRWFGFNSATRAANAFPGRGGGAGATGGTGGTAAGAAGRAGGATGAVGAGRAGAATGRGVPPNAFMHDAALMTEEMRVARSEGIGLIVDGGHPDMGRDFNFLKQISQASGLPIVAGAGFYTQPFYPKDIATMTEEQITRALVKQCEDEPVGAFGEIGSWDDMTKDERKVFRAVGKAHLATNLPIFTHTGIPGKAALQQLDILEDAGVAPGRIVIGHLGNLTGDTSLAVHRAICRRGAFIGFDRQGGNSDAMQVPMVMGLIEAGYADNLMFSSDLSMLAETKRGGGPGYAKTLTVFVPKLKAAGASDEVLRQIMQDNPRRFLAFVPKVRRKA